MTVVIISLSRLAERSESWPEQDFRANGAQISFHYFIYFHPNFVKLSRETDFHWPFDLDYESMIFLEI